MQIYLLRHGIAEEGRWLPPGSSMSESPKFDDVDAKLFHSSLMLLFRDLGVDNLADAQARIRELKERVRPPTDFDGGHEPH